MKNKYIYIAVFLLFTHFMVWLLTVKTITKDTVIQQKEKIVYKYKYALKEAEIKRNADYILRLPYTDFGIKKQFLYGFGLGLLL